MNWQIWIDTGGTFTDYVARAPDGRVQRGKVLSTSALRGRIDGVAAADRITTVAPWAAGADLVRGFTFRRLGDETVRRVTAAAAGTLQLDAPLPRAAPGDAFEVRAPYPAPVLAARLATATPAEAALPPLDLRLATTRGTNALLEGQGADVALFVTEGFGDLLRIGDQQRPDLFARHVVRPAPLPRLVVEVPERVAADGTVLRPLDLAAFEPAARAARAAGATVAAVALLHADRHGDHERALAGRLREIGFDHVTASADAAASIRLLARAETAVVDAFLAPVVGDYLRTVAAGAGDGDLRVMTSAGGLAPARAFAPRHSLLSGPAGGVAGTAAVASAAGAPRVLSLDMGGTSTDVARYDGDYEYRFEHAVAGHRILAPALAIETVAAGGGSVCGYDHGRLRVGPESAGADPGPACYGNGGPLTLTDVNLLLGRLGPFQIPIDRAAAAAALDALCARIAADGAAAARPEDVLEGLLAIADERMADAIAEVSLRRGVDPADYALVAFGGAGGQHACAVAERLGIDTVLFPADAAVLSAVGLGHALIERHEAEQVLAPLVSVDVAARLDDLAAAGRAGLADEGLDPAALVVRRRLASVRLTGQTSSLDLEVGDPAGLADAFAARYRNVFGHAPPAKPLELVALRVVVSEAASAPAGPAGTPAPDPVSWETTTTMPFDGGLVTGGASSRAALRPGAQLTGPGLVHDAGSTIVLRPGWTALVAADGTLRARHAGREATDRADRPDVVRRELFANRFAAVAREMGEVLRRVAVSTNVKERLDYSCAVLDAEGALVVNAPHIPVHLGALGPCVRSVRDALPLAPGDVVITNHPAFGGSHLPDVTLVTPVFAGGAAPVAFVASRAHHAEIGGTWPGSMPADARALVEEGVVIPPTHLVRGGHERLDVVEDMLRSAPYPSRAVADNLADLRGQLAANHRGATALATLVDVHGAGAVRAQMRAVTERAARLARGALRDLDDGRRAATVHLDDGTPLAVSVAVTGETAVVDFTGSGPVHPGNLNATAAIVRSAVLYVVRLLVGRPRGGVPLNEGLLEPVTLVVPEGFLAPGFPADPADAPAVVGGNVETSQRIVEALLLALELGAASQGTMNNVIFGTDAFGYYETVGGGAGADPEGPGADAVHTHMTNTRITDAEVLEHRHPVRIERFAVRTGSGGAGRHRGGDGIVRVYRFLAPMQLSVLGQHRTVGPPGAAGGAAGRAGVHRVERADGRVERLGAAAGCAVGPGDCFILETPGGGGWGPPAGR